MTQKRKVEVFTAGSCCDDAVQLVKSIACSSCDVQVLDMNDAAVSERARELGVTRAPAVAIDGKLASCCVNGGSPDEQALRDAGLGRN